jgi:hypothetical protein
LFLTTELGDGGVGVLKPPESATPLIGELWIGQASHRVSPESGKKPTKLMPQSTWEDRTLTAQSIVDSSNVKPKDLKSAREAYQPISTAMIKLVKITSPTSEIADKLYVAYCPMAEASWIQKTAEISNPFMGQKMLTCGEVTEEIPLR